MLLADGSGFWDKEGLRIACCGGIVKLQTLHRVIEPSAIKILAFKDPEKEPWDGSPMR